MYQVVRGGYHFIECGVPYHHFSFTSYVSELIRRFTGLNDFGCSRFPMNGPYSSYAGALYFCPPEWLITGKYCAGPATVWKMGVLMYWLLFGDYPFKSVGDWQLHYPFNVEVSGDCLSLISGCLKEDPEERLKFDQILDHMYFLA
ncbi:serine/threonine-protein kinase pim-2-like [Clarias gariepinus]|uniref:serine/threonine-protein kinase pim-2-like n=1 Tax=Clarias gariepinus TaxID=13013 RepID=UPI00234C6A74|nr:serine/threonine-protein kinase pim-2-like [Clarias gariepinus]